MDVHHEASRSSPPQYSHPQILRVVTGIILCMLLAALDQTVVIPAVPAIARDLHSYEHLAWIVTAYLLTSTAATPIFGKLSDTHGRRRRCPAGRGKG
jgi:MFS family permease